MIVEFALGASLLAVGAVAAVLQARRARARRAAAAAEAARAEVARRAAPPRGLRVGDVLLYGETELWLAGALHLEEDGLVMRLFRIPGSARACWLAQLDEAGEELALLQPTERVPDGVVPESLPIDGQCYALRRRGVADVTAEGHDVPTGLPRARYVELRATGGRMLLVVDLGRDAVPSLAGAERLALRGELIPRAAVDLLPAGDLSPKERGEGP
jgi:hypothetical protein